MRFPPRLTAGQMFWWSVGLIVGSFVVGLLGVASLGPSITWSFAFVHAQSLLLTLGVAGIVGSFVVRALEPRGTAPSRSPRNVDREQNV